MNPVTVNQQKAEGGYQGASRIDRALALWAPSLRIADADILPEKDILDARAVERSKNDGFMSGAVQLHRDSIVGAFYRLNLKPNYKYLGLSEDWANEFQEAVEAEFMLAADSPECWLDASGTLTFTDMVRLAVVCSMIPGETLATVEWLRDRNRPFKTCIQMLDPMRLTDPAGENESTGWRKGVKTNKFGRPEKYGIKVRSEDDMYALGLTFDVKVVDARKPWGRKQVIHMFENRRPEQTRGISDIVSILKQSRMVSKYQDVVLQNAVLNASYAASIESELPPAEVFDSMNDASSWANNFLESVAEYQAGSKNLHIDGVKIPVFYPGTTMKLQNAGQPGGIGSNYEESLLRYLAAGFGLSYEEFSRDFTKTNYSSARAAMGETWKIRQAKKKSSGDRFATDVFMVFFEERFNAGAFNDVLPRRRPNFYERMNKEAYTNCTWIGAARGQIDELKETNAAILRIQSGLSTFEKECARFGDDFREVFKQRLREQKMIKDMGLRLGSNIEPNKDSNDDEEEEKRSAVA